MRVLSLGAGVQSSTLLLMAARREVRDHNHKMTGQQFLHRSFLPLDQVDLRSEQDRGQLDMFDGCGVLCAADEQP